MWQVVSLNQIRSFVVDGCIRDFYLQHNKRGQMRICGTIWNKALFRVRSFRSKYFDESLIKPFSIWLINCSDEYDCRQAKYTFYPF